MVAIDAERLIGAMLRTSLGGAKAEQPKAVAALPVATAESEPQATDVAQVAPPVAEDAMPAREPDRRPRTSRGEHRGRDFGDRDRGPRGRGGREREREPRDNGRPATPSPEPKRTTPPKDDHREFWEVWSEEVGRTPNPTQEAPSVAPVSVPPVASMSVAPVAPFAPVAVGASPPEQPADGSVRLYVNLGRKDGVTPEAVAEQLAAAGVSLPSSDVELMNTHCYINVSAEVAETLCQKLNGRLYNGRAIVCERARPPRRR